MQEPTQGDLSDVRGVSHGCQDSIQDLCSRLSGWRAEHPTTLQGRAGGCSIPPLHPPGC